MPNLPTRLLDAACRAFYLEWPADGPTNPVDAEFCRDRMRGVVAAVCEELGRDVEAERAEARRGRPGYAVGNWTFNEGIDRAAELIRSTGKAVTE